MRGALLVVLMHNSDSVRGDVDGLEDSAIATAAVRECFEEAGVWLGDGSPSDDLRDALNHRKGTLCDMLLWSPIWNDSHCIRCDSTAEPKRYDAFFFITELRADELFTPQADQSDSG